MLGGLGGHFGVFGLVEGGLGEESACSDTGDGFGEGGRCGFGKVSAQDELEHLCWDERESKLRDPTSAGVADVV